MQSAYVDRDEEDEEGEVRKKPSEEEQSETDRDLADPRR